MACPYFFPVEVRGGSPLLPLGGHWWGECRAQAESPSSELRGDWACNLGYARGECERFPSSDGPDAVRFAIAGDREGAPIIEYALERDHLPFAHGRLECLPACGNCSAPAEHPYVERLAWAYAERYRQLKEEC
jgi:hypothetical protein